MNEDQLKLIDEFKEELKLTGKSIQNVNYMISIFFEYLDKENIDYQSLKVREAQNFQTYLVTLRNDKGEIKYGKHTVSGIVSFIKSFYLFLKRKKLIYSNPFNFIKLVKYGKSLPKNILNEEKMNTFLNHLKEFWKGKNLNERRKLYKCHVISELMYSTGARINEVMKLRVEDINFERGVLRLCDSKTKTIREGILNEYSQKVLKLFIDMRELIIFGKNGGDLKLLFGSSRNLKMWLNKVLMEESNKLGYGRFNSHNFRHAVGYHMLRGGCDIRYIQAILGHKKLSSTQIYTKVEKEDLRNVIDKFHPRVFRGRNEE